MSQIRFFTDEDVYGMIAPKLRNLGFDACSAPEANRLGLPDEDQLAWASTEERTLISFNTGHFAALHAAYLKSGSDHAGIVLSSRRSIGQMLKRLRNLASIIDADTMINRLEYLSDW